MAMSKYCIMSLMMRKENAATDVDPFSFAAQMAELLAQISSKLTAEELAFFVRAGGKIYDAGVKEYGTGVPMEDLFPSRENLNPQLERGGFRKDAYRRKQ
jgi:hypothetical protein